MESKSKIYPEPAPPKVYELTLRMTADETKHLYNLTCMNVCIPGYYDVPKKESTDDPLSVPPKGIYGITPKSMEDFLWSLRDAMREFNCTRMIGPQA